MNINDIKAGQASATDLNDRIKDTSGITKNECIHDGGFDCRHCEITDICRLRRKLTKCPNLNRCIFYPLASECPNKQRT